MSEKNYKVIFFDLDHTLWDYHRNADETLASLFSEYLSPKTDISVPDLIAHFKRINDELWAQYHKGQIGQYKIRNTRFTMLLSDLGIEDDGLAGRLGEDYITEGPKGSHLFPNAHETLEYLKEKYPLFIITNGFEHTQHQKVHHSGIKDYFSAIFTSETIGIQKPKPGIFEYVLDQTGYRAEEAIMIGDNLDTDISGARNAGIDSVHFKPDATNLSNGATYTISDLIELKQLL